MKDSKPIGFMIQKQIQCCSSCQFGGYLGNDDEASRVYVCEIFGEPSDSDYFRIRTDPLGICDAFKKGVK